MNKGLIGIFEGATKNQKTLMGVAEATNYYTAKGYVVCWPPPDAQCDWDMLAAPDGGLGVAIKVQVKTTGYIHPSNGKSWIVGLKDGGYVDQEKVKVPWNFDELCVLDGDGEVTVMKASDILVKSDGENRKHSIVIPRFPSKARLPL
tara:strand:+ start:43 stop:483 length:441 start_codon:yes stop_codon:yes gene_type:complete